MCRFCRAAHGEISRTDYILTHHMGAAFSKVADDMDKLLGVHWEGFSSARCRMGTYKIIRKTEKIG